MKYPKTIIIYENSQEQVCILEVMVRASEHNKLKFSGCFYLPTIVKICKMSIDYDQWLWMSFKYENDRMSNIIITQRKTVIVYHNCYSVVVLKTTQKAL